VDTTAERDAVRDRDARTESRRRRRPQREAEEVARSSALLAAGAGAATTPVAVRRACMELARTPEAVGASVKAILQRTKSFKREPRGSTVSARVAGAFNGLR
jgi:hypothetical protein